MMVCIQRVYRKSPFHDQGGEGRLQVIRCNLKHVARILLAIRLST